MEFGAEGLVLRVVPLAVKDGKSLYNYYGNVAEARAQVLRLRQELGTRYCNSQYSQGHSRELSNRLQRY